MPYTLRSASLLLVVTLTLIGRCGAEPYQCQELRAVISRCSCEGKMVNGVQDDSKVVINCINIGLTTVPSISGASSYLIYEMTLAQNSIQTIPASAFDGLRIERLDLRDNRLTNVSPDAFQGLAKYLQELYIGADVGSATELPLVSLRNLTALHTLELNYFKFPSNIIDRDDGLHLLSNLKSLTLKNNNLVSILTLPVSLTSLTLDNEGLYGLPVDVLQTLTQLQTLVLTHTNIASVGFEVFSKLTNLTHLDLGYNKINTLNTGCFTGITATLQSLSLRNNPIPNAGILNEVKTLTAVTSLQLSNLGLTTLPADPEFLRNKAALTSLHLEANSLTSLGPDVFTGLGAVLRELSLAHNQLGSMDDQSLAGLTALTSLDLSHQTVAQPVALPASLASLPALRTLKMSGTPLRQDALWQRVGGLSTLTTLVLDSTGMTSIPDYALSNLTQLTELNLDSNHLTSLTQAQLAGPRNLAKLLAASNNITSVSSCTFHRYLLSPTSALRLELLDNPLHCDCQLDWLLQEVSDNRIDLSGLERCSTPASQSGVYLISKRPGDFTCSQPQPQPSCLELYTTTAPPPEITTQLGEISLSVANVTSTTLRLQWAIARFPDLTHFRLTYMDLSISDNQLTGEIDPAQREHLLTGLTPGTRYSVCVRAYTASASASTLQTCTTADTPPATPGGSGGQGGDDDDSSSSETGVIVGVVIGVLALLVILAAILYIVLVRKRTAKSELPVQPHTFSASELPGMGPGTKNFTRPPQQKQPPKVGRAMDEAIKVTVISDGRTGGPHHAGGSLGPRQSAGSYQFLDQKHPNPNPEVASSSADSSKAYTDSVDDRPLPTAPQDSMKGYYNNGFHKEAGDAQKHTYNQINI